MNIKYWRHESDRPRDSSFWSFELLILVTSKVSTHLVHVVRRGVDSVPQWVVLLAPEEPPEREEAARLADEDPPGVGVEAVDVECDQVEGVLKY